MSARTVEALISGKVQGVYYRGWTREQATGLGLTGWVRNNPDGTVSAFFQGGADDVQAMLARCWQGPRDAQVTGIEIRDVVPPPMPGDGFRILR